VPFGVGFSECPAGVPSDIARPDLSRDEERKSTNPVSVNAGPAHCSAVAGPERRGVAVAAGLGDAGNPWLAVSDGVLGRTIAPSWLLMCGRGVGRVGRTTIGGRADAADHRAL